MLVGTRMRRQQEAASMRKKVGITLATVTVLVLCGIWLHAPAQQEQQQPQQHNEGVIEPGPAARAGGALQPRQDAAQKQPRVIQPPPPPPIVEVPVTETTTQLITQAMDNPMKFMRR